MMRQVRHEDGKKVQRSMLGSAELMAQYHVDMARKNQDETAKIKRQRKEMLEKRRKGKKKLKQSAPPQVHSLTKQDVNIGQKQLYLQDTERDIQARLQEIEIAELEKRPLRLLASKNNKKESSQYSLATGMTMESVAPLDTPTAILKKKSRLRGSTCVTLEQMIEQKSDCEEEFPERGEEAGNQEKDRVAQRHFNCQADWQVTILNF